MSNIIRLGGGGADPSVVTAGASDVLAGKVIIDSSGNSLTGTIPSKVAATYTPSTTNQTIAAGQYLSGGQTIKGDTNLSASNIMKGVSIFGVTGTLKGVKSLKVVKTTTAVNSLGINPNYAIAVPIATPLNLITTQSNRGHNHRVSNLVAGGNIEGPNIDTFNSHYLPVLVIEFDTAVIKSKQQGSYSGATGTVTINAVTIANCIVLCYGATINRTSSHDQTHNYSAELTDRLTLTITGEGTDLEYKGCNWVVLEFVSGVL